jgi:formate dehydrogenase subunit delta
MSSDKYSILIRMANQIGTFFEAMPDRAEALQDAAGHIKRSWALSMRKDLLEYIDSHGLDAFHPIAAAAITTHRGSLV